MKRPSLAALFWFLAFLVVSALLVRSRIDHTSKQSDDKSAYEDITFDSKMFYDSGGAGLGDFINVSGTLSGEGVGYKNNTMDIACNRDRLECLVTSIQQIGRNQIGRLDAPEEYKIIKWDNFEVVSVNDPGSAECSKVTISLERQSKTVLWVQEPVNQATVACKDSDKKIYKWTIEDSLFWQRDRQLKTK